VHVAVLGGGQLGRMLALAGIPMGIGFSFLDPAPDACAAACGRLVVGALDDPVALEAATEHAETVTYEWEGVPADAVRRLAAAGRTVRPGATSLEVAQDRLAEKTAFTRLGIPTPAFRAVDGRADLEAAAAELGLPLVVKTRRGGYDGKGQAVVQQADRLASAWERLGPSGPLIAEAFVPFDRELSVLAVRDRHGEVRCWPIPENHHAEGILRRSVAPAPGLSPAVAAAAEAAVTRLAAELDHVGVLCLELFQVGESILANELAPRVHNSGHWTIEGAVTSQFANHLRAVCGWPLGEVAARGHSAMLNCIGALPEPAAVLAVPGAALHRYGKALRPGRKVGHVTVVADDADTLTARVEALRPHVG
jgi:5-(carboxyamino)imidazole ribonucleotide synthase